MAEGDQWYRVDLQQQYFISSVQIISLSMFRGLRRLKWDIWNDIQKLLRCIDLKTDKFYSTWFKIGNFALTCHLPVGSEWEVVFFSVLFCCVSSFKKQNKCAFSSQCVLCGEMILFIIWILIWLWVSIGSVVMNLVEDDVFCCSICCFTQFARAMRASPPPRKMTPVHPKCWDRSSSRKFLETQVTAKLLQNETKRGWRSSNKESRIRK